jgi:CRISPR type III-associated protein (TIGR04423 family)
MSGIKQYKTLNEIPNLSFEGYIWMSDQEQPKILNKEIYDFKSIAANPFIIEALLYNEKENRSIHIQHSGEYQIYEYDLNHYSTEQLTAKSYLPHRLEGVKKVHFKQVWLPVTDDNGEGMEVLTLKAIVFCGFNKNNDHE